MAYSGGGSLRHVRASERASDATGGPSRGTAITRLERELKGTRGENMQLKEELSAIKSLYEQLVFEAPQEQFCERRVHLLKSQLSLLERQVTVQNHALQSRSQLLTDLAALMDYILSCGRGREDEPSREEGKEGGKKPSSRTGFSADQVATLLEKAKVMRARISRCARSTAPAPLRFPHLPPSLLAQPAHVCTCGPDAGSHEDTARIATCQLNLQYVSSLESELAQLYGNLTQLQSSLQLLPCPPSSHSPSSQPPSSYPPSPPFLSSSLLRPLTDHYQQLVTVTSDLVADCCHHLLTLSLLAPSCSALPPSSKTTSTHTINVTDSLLSRLKPHIKNKKEATEIVQEVVKSVKHTELLREQKTSALEEEVSFHKSVYQLQVNYVSSLFESVRKGYEAFEAAAQELVCTPVEEILASYSEFSRSADEDKLKLFLVTFQEREKSLRHVVDSLKPSPQDKNGDILDHQGGAALSAFGEHFFKSLQQLERECHKKRQLLSKKN